MKKHFFILSILLFIFSVNTFASSFTIEAENMTLGGPYAGKISSPFSGIALYANGDKGTTTHAFPDGDGNYKVSIVGASNNSNAAGVSLYVNDVKLKAFTFYGTTPSTLEAEVKITGLKASNTIVLLLETDNGSSDTFIDKITFTFQGAIVVKNPPVLPTKGAYFSGEYRNMLAEAGYSATQINQKLNNLWNHFFYGNASTQAIYYPVGTDEAYILDTGNDDVRSEGMSYGMMVCVQMNKQAEFNRLWKWAKIHMQHQSGARKGYFAWQVDKNGSMRDQNPASDGEEYFIMALMFASGRWGDGDGIFNYWKEAGDILKACLSKESGTIQESVTNLFNSTHKQVVFTPYANAATFTDPSYHLPAFYQLWSYWADANRPFFAELAAKSREMFPKFAHSTTGLMPDYANFDGSPTGGNHADFRFDAWRCIMNMAVDYAWFKADEKEVEQVNKMHNFFAGKGLDSYVNQYSLAGNSQSSERSPGLFACNAAGALASNQAVAWDFIDEFFNAGIPTGRYRYYDGLLYFMNYLHLSGNFKIYSELAPIKNPGDPNDPDDPNDPGYTTPDGYYVINDFESYQLNHELYDGGNVTATVKANPTIASQKSANVIIKNYDSYWRISVKLPKGKTLADYEKLMFDIYLPTGYDNGFKTTYAAINSTTLNLTPGGNMDLDKWITKECAIPAAVSSLSTFELYLGYRTGNGFFYIDNIKLKGEPDPVTEKIPVADENSFYYSDNMLYIRNAFVDNVSIFGISGNLLVSENNISSSLDISDLNSGVYLVRISTNGQVYNMKIVK
ncbi:MAG: T9SS type A sorting domain-containing protein [Dysgonamonadaceae bacterium]|jgi:endo-1,4-beta-D-glucanase Y|nr:T9SS type A sorting domain-containing protein [Dysgonamonadaceae bacterium]